MPNRPAALSLFVFLTLVALAAASRFADVAPNFAAVGAASLFAGFWFRHRLVAVAVPLTAMLLSDLAIGFYEPVQMLAVYGALALPVFLARLVTARTTALRVIGVAAGGSVAFFGITNFAVWTGGMYGWSAQGLVACYVAAVPFFKYTLASDVLVSCVLFGVWAACRAARPAPRPAYACIA